MESNSRLEAHGEDPVPDADEGSTHNIAKQAVLEDESQVGNEGNDEEVDADEGSTHNIAKQAVLEGDSPVGNEGNDEEVEEEECGFCLYMKGGPCKESFIKWEECVEQAEKLKEDIVAKCHKVTFVLKECMEENSDYYGPVLKAEREIDEQSELQEQSEKAAGSKEGNFTSESEKQLQNGGLDELRQGAGGSEEGNVGNPLKEGSRVVFQTEGEEGLKQAALQDHMEEAKASAEGSDGQADPNQKNKSV